MRQRQNYQWMQKLNRIFQRYWLPLLLGVVTTIAVLGTWPQLIAYEQLHVQQLVQQEANGVDWQVQVFATAALIASGRSLLPTLVLWGGLVGASALALMAFLGQQSERYARRARKMNHQLQEEIIHRQRVEANLRESEERLQFVFEASGEGWWDWDITAGQVKRSPQYLKLLEYEVGEFPDVVDSWKASIHPDDFPHVMKQLTMHLQDGLMPYTYDYRVLTKSGRWHWIADYGMVVARDANNQPQRMIGMFKDINDRKCQEFALRQAMEATEAANLARSTFLANMSHELRTPLNVILGFAQVMAYDPSLTPHQQDDLQTICRSGDHLLSLINDVLDLSKIEAGHSNLEEDRFDLRALLHTLYTMMTERANSKQIQLGLEIPPEIPQFVIADEQKLRQVLLNLLSNAIKFTERGSVTLSVSFALERSPSSPTASDHRTTEPHINLRFNIVELMHGEISVHSIAHGGSTFTVTVPVYSTSESQGESESRDRLFSLAPSQPRHRILVVDDHSENRLLLVRLLTQLGLEVKEVTNGKDAIRMWQDWHPALIWMDVRMPETDGYETTKQIRALEPEHHTIIIALTAHASQSDRTLALAAGCDDYITKPFRAELLFQKLKDYLGLEYLYTESTVAPVPQSVEPSSDDAAEALNPTLPASLPSEWLYSLEAAAICGNNRAIVELATQLPPSFDRLGKQLTELAEKYQFEQILQLIHDSSLL